MSNKFWDQFDPDRPSMTHQSFKDECDINVVVARCMRTGSLVDPLTGATRQPLYGDFTSSASDFQEAQNLLADANTRFASLPSGLRARFSNDPASLLSFLEDPSNRQEAVKLGLIPELTTTSEPSSNDTTGVIDNGTSVV